MINAFTVVLMMLASASLLLGDGVSPSENSLVEMWDVTSGKKLLTLSSGGDSIFTAAWSPDGRRLATVAWSSVGKYLAAIGDDDRTRVWDAQTGEGLLTLSGHSDSVSSVAWSPDGKRLATGSDDRTVQIYAMDIRDLIALARQRVTAHPSEEGCKKYLNMDKCPPVPVLSWW
jgi:WD40 repeat protein